MSKREIKDNVVACRYFMASLRDLDQWLIRLSIETKNPQQEKRIEEMSEAASQLHKRMGNLMAALRAEEVNPSDG